MRAHLFPVLLSAELTQRRQAGALGGKYLVVNFVKIYTQALRKPLAGRLVHCAQEHPAQVKDYSPDRRDSAVIRTGPILAFFISNHALSLDFLHYGTSSTPG